MSGPAWRLVTTDEEKFLVGYPWLTRKSYESRPPVTRVDLPEVEIRVWHVLDTLIIQRSTTRDGAEHFSAWRKDEQ